MSARRFAFLLNVSSPFDHLPLSVDSIDDVMFSVYSEPDLEAVVDPNVYHHVVYDRFQFVINTFVIGALCVFGVSLNTLSMVILHRDRHNTVAVFLLQSLAIADSSVLIIAFVALSIFYGLLPTIGLTDVVLKASPFFMQFINPVGYAVQSCTIWITVLLAVNRYIAICKPFTAEKLLTMRLTVIQVSVVVALSFGLNIPRIFQFEFDVDVANQTSGQNGTVSCRTVRHFSSLGRSKIFEIGYIATFYTAFVLVLPLIILCALNCMIVLSLRASRHRMKLNSITGLYRQDSSITIVMVAVVAELVVCHLPDRVMMILKYALYQEDINGPACPHVICYLENLFNLLVIVSSSTNFIIYFALRPRFRVTLRRHLLIFCCRYCRPDEVDRLRRQSAEDAWDSLRRTNGTGSRADSCESTRRVSLPVKSPLSARSSTAKLLMKRNSSAAATIGSGSFLSACIKADKSRKTIEDGSCCGRSSYRECRADRPIACLQQVLIHEDSNGTSKEVGASLWTSESTSLRTLDRPNDCTADELASQEDFLSLTRGQSSPKFNGLTVDDEL